MADPAAQQRLEAELARVQKEYNFDRLVETPGKTPAPPLQDARVALVDALLACQAGQGTLTAAKVEALRNLWTDKGWLVWTAALEWTHRYQDESEVARLIRDGVALREPPDLARAVGVEPPTAPVRAVRDFLVSRRDLWPLARGLAVQEAGRGTPASLFYVVIYTYVMVAEAKAGGGAFTLSDDVVKAFAAATIETCRGLSMNCKILAACRPSKPSPEWTKFLEGHATFTDPKDELYVEFVIDAIKTAKAAPPADPPADLHPGVRLPGFHAPLAG
jgi:hypothetical protein